MPNFTVLEETGSGYAKVRYENLDTTGYRNLNTGEPVSESAFHGSKAQDEYTPVRDSETGQIITNVKDENAYQIRGSPQEVKDGYRVLIHTPDDLDHIRGILEENPKKWGAFQIKGNWTFMCKTGEERQITGGYSQVHSEITRHNYRVAEPVYGEDGDTIIDTNFREENIDTVELAYHQAESHAWSHIDCSIVSWDLENLDLILYLDKPSEWYNQVETQSHLIING